MPPRKKSTPASVRARKLTPKSEKSYVESTSAVEDNGSRQEGGSTPVKHERDRIKQEFVVLGANSAEADGLPITPVEARVKEEVVEEERNVNAEGFIQNGGVAEEDGERMEGGGVQGQDGHMAEVTEKSDGEAEERGAEGEQNEGGDVVNGGTQLDIVPVAEQNSYEEGTAAAQINEAEALGDNVLVLNEGSDGGGDEGGGKDEEDIADSEEDNEVDNEDEEHSSLLINNHITDRKKEKDLEIFIGRLDKKAVEVDLIEVFGKFGEIKTARVVRNRTTNKSRGFAFIQYASVEQAKNALSALKDGTEVRGKHVKISASQDNDTLYMGNICKLWTKELVLGALKSYGIENIEEVHLPDDPQKEGKIKGFAFLEFSAHSDAMAAFQRLRKPDAVFGCDRSAKVAFAQTPMHPNQEVLSQVKTVYVEGLTDAWNKEKLKEIGEQYGEIEEVKLSQSLGTKRKDYGFITFSSRESALACVEGINNAHIGEGEVKVKASIAKPHVKGRLQKQGTRGGFKVEKKRALPSPKEESERENKAVSSKLKGQANSKRARKKGKTVVEEKGKALSEPVSGGGKPNKPKTVTEGQSIQASSKLERSNRKRKNLHLKAEDRGKTGAEHGQNEKPSKKQKGNMRGRQNKNSRKPKRDLHIRKGPNYGADFIRYRNPYAPGYAASAVSYQSRASNSISGSKRPYADDMEPHAGYIEPVARKQGRSYAGYLETPVGMQYQPHPGYLASAVGTQSQPHTVYYEAAVGKHGRPHAYLEPDLGTHGQPHAGYLEPAVGIQGGSHAGYYESAVGKHSHDPHDLVLRRSGGQDIHGSAHSAYGTGTSLPTSYVPNYTSYAGYEDGRSVGGHYQSSESHLPRRAYY